MLVAFEDVIALNAKIANLLLGIEQEVIRIRTSLKVSSGGGAPRTPKG